MKVAIDLENLEKIIEKTLDKNIENVIKEQVTLTVQRTVDSIAEDIIKERVNDNFKNFVDDYIKTTKITIGGGWSDEPKKEYTVEQYIKKLLKEKLESNTLRVKRKGTSGSYSSDYANVTFEEYINNRFNPEEMVKKELDGFMDDIRRQINETMKNTFDESTKNMLSSAVLNILGANETYRQIENNIKCIADIRA